VKFAFAGVYCAPSTLISNVEPSSVEENVNVALEDCVALAEEEVIAVSGGWVSLGVEDGGFE
jgi:hypothetical protein